MIESSWTVVKSFINLGLSFKYTTINSNYYIYAYDDAFSINCIIPQDSPANSDQNDFETNYKNKGNVRLVQLDSDNAPLARIKQAPTGWSFHLRALDFTTALETSLVNNDASNTAVGDASITLYDSNGNVVSGSINRLTAVKTVIDIEPTYDYYIIGGRVRVQTAPTSDIRCSVIAVPDIPANQGGSKVFLQNLNFKFLSNQETVEADGRASKSLSYNATYHTNKLRFTFFHNAGTQCSFEIMLEIYKQ